MIAAVKPKENILYTRFGALARNPRRATQAVLSQALAIGQSFDIYGSASMSSLLGPLFDFSSMPTKKIDFLGHEVEVPIIVNWIGSTDSSILEGYGESREAFQDKISARLGVKTRVGGFTGEANASFAMSSSNSSEQTYSYKKFYSQLGIFQYQPGYEQYLTPEFKDAVERLPSSVDDQNFVEFAAFFNRFGIYFVTRTIPGANLTYGATVSKSAGMMSADLEASAKASYNALFAGVSIKADFAASRAWQSYQANSRIRISTRGGDPAVAARLEASDPYNPNTAATTGAFQEWVQSAEAEPANVDFHVTGIWELAGSKRDAVLAAWELYGPRMRPTVSAVSTVFVHPTEHAPERPLIQLNGNLVDVPQAPGDMGLDVIIFDGNNLLAPPLFKRQYGMNAAAWFEEYTAFWGQVAREIAASGAAVSPNLLVLASYNFEWNAVPTSDAANILVSAGAERLLPDWINMSDPGSCIGNTRLTLHPANIQFAGFFGGPLGSAVESYNYMGWTDLPQVKAMTITLNHQTSGARYVIVAVENER